MKNDTVYIVSSFHRSGSSMMMRCLEAGGLEAYFDPFLDTAWNLIYGNSDYTPNPNGFYHTDDEQTDWPSFHSDHKGKVVKVFRRDLHILRPGAYKVVFMTRNPDEVRASMRAFSPNTTWGHMEVATHFYDQIKDATLEALRKRPDMEILEVNYGDVIADPVKQFEKIRDFGIPIDPEKAAAMVDSSLHRFRLERV